MTNSAGKVRDRKRLPQFERYWALRPGCRVAMEACASSHFRCRDLEQRGFEVVLLPDRFLARGPAEDLDAMGASGSP